jgi:site-specific DNA recombinase
MRTAIYARFSSDKQSETSLTDQVNLCQSRAKREGWPLVATHTDNALSGSTQVASRPGGKALLADMLAGRFDVLLVEGLDRLARDQVEQESVVRRMEHRGIRIIGLADGYDSQHQGRKVMRGVRGLINELYLDDLRHKTQRGMHGQVDRGYIAGGKSYGYDIIKDEIGSRYVINEEQAHWVRWIFQKVANGHPFRHIVFELNARGVPSPRGDSWAVSAVYGSPQKGSGIVNNQLYAGCYIWNRSQWVKDPDTGKRQRVDRPRHEWRVQDVPALRIVDQETWDRVRARIDAGRGADGKKRAQRPRSALLSGVLRCPHCGGPLNSGGTTQYICTKGHDRGPTVCPGFSVGRKRLDRRMLSVVRDEVLTDDVAQMIEQLVIERRQFGSDSRTVEALQARRDALQGELSNLVDAIARIGISAPIEQRIRQAERELHTLEYEIGQASAEPVDLVDVRREFQAVRLDFENAIQVSPAEARRAIVDILGSVQLEVKDSELWAHIATGPALQVAVGADVCNDGCGGRI